MLSIIRVHRRYYGKKLIEYNNGEVCFDWKGEWVWCLSEAEAKAFLDRKRKADARIIHQRLYSSKYATIR